MMTSDPLPSLETWRKSGELVQLLGHQIFVAEFGAAIQDQAPLVLIHGFPTSSFDYARLVPLLSPHRRLILLDLLGFGYSDKPRAHDYSLFEQAALVEELAKKRQLGAVELVAHDMGDSVALLLLQRGVLNVSRLVLLNGSVLLKYYQPLITQRLLLNPVIGPLLTSLGVISKPVFGKQFRKLFPKPPPDAEIDAFWSLIAHNGGAKIYHLLIRYLNERKRHEYEWLDALKSHRAPLLILWGQRDPVSVPRIAQALAETRPDARYVPLPELGHYPQWEDPATIARLPKMASFRRTTGLELAHVQRGRDFLPGRARARSALRRPLFHRRAHDANLLPADLSGAHAALEERRLFQDGRGG
jgi:pimeloyl-ACP methyl ester carboxylesterase